MLEKVSTPIIFSRVKNLMYTFLSDYDIALVRINYPVQDYESGAYNVAWKIHGSSTINIH